jgi:hypothetical protein
MKMLLALLPLILAQADEKIYSTEFAKIHHTFINHYTYSSDSLKDLLPKLPSSPVLGYPKDTPLPKSIDNLYLKHTTH